VTNGTIEGLQGSIAAPSATREGGQSLSDTGERRDAIAIARDLAALARDRAADARDRAMAEREFADEPGVGGRPLTATDKAIRAKGRRKRAAQHYAQATEYRALAAQDRQAAARDREQAARDRSRVASEPATGARARAAGLTDVDRELSRCRRTSGSLVVAFVAVVANDAEGHHLSDEMLERVSACATSQLRSYDLVIRIGGDRLACAMSNMTVADARKRFTSIAAAITGASDESAIQTGFAAVAPYETATALIARAEQELIASRDGKHNGRPELPADISANGHP
jgi:diguanylate cyclase (GGDEF)-like protein